MKTLLQVVDRVTKPSRPASYRYQCEAVTSEKCVGKTSRKKKKKK